MVTVNLVVICDHIKLLQYYYYIPHAVHYIPVTYNWKFVSLNYFHLLCPTHPTTKIIFSSYFFLVTLGFRCCLRLSLVAVRGLLIVVASLVVEQGLYNGLSCSGAYTQFLFCMWNLPGPGIKPVCPTLAGGVLSTVRTMEVPKIISQCHVISNSSNQFPDHFKEILCIFFLNQGSRKVSLLIWYFKVCIPAGGAWQPTPVFLLGESSWTEEPGGLQFIGWKRVRHNWSDIACIQASLLIGQFLFFFFLSPFIDFLLEKLGHLFCTIFWKLCFCWFYLYVVIFFYSSYPLSLVYL